MSRKNARELAFKIIFAESFSETTEKIDETFANNIANAGEMNEELNKDDITYINDVVSGVQKNLESLDSKIKEHLKGWTMERICKTDLAILRLAIYEILYREDIPYKVSVNEAIELAKLFSEDGSPSFINRCTS